jgi:hypothetical protein
VSIAIKPTSSIRLPRRSINRAGEATIVETHGRHDPCVGIRAAPIAEAMLALVLIDHALRIAHRTATCGTRRHHCAAAPKLMPLTTGAPPDPDGRRLAAVLRRVFRADRHRAAVPAAVLRATRADGGPYRRADRYRSGDAHGRARTCGAGWLTAANAARRSCARRRLRWQRRSACCSCRVDSASCSSSWC